MAKKPKTLRDWLEVFGNTDCIQLQGISLSALETEIGAVAWAADSDGDTALRDDLSSVASFFLPGCENPTFYLVIDERKLCLVKA